MLLGLIADTHDNLDAVEKAIRLFNARGVSCVLHAGDWNAPFTLARFQRAECRVIGVFGNVDGEREGLRSRAEEVGVELLGNFGEMVLGGLRIALIHGRDEAVVEALALSGKYDIVVRGHTHKKELRTVGRTLVVNPGEAGGHLTNIRTVALLDTERRDVEFVEI